ncbi:MAG: hypothetical protein GYA16_08645 [Spirochaetes bacterium]|nr:hypothetical protein [Spirochaetota bacterium]
MPKINLNLKMKNLLFALLVLLISSCKKDETDQNPFTASRYLQSYAFTIMKCSCGTDTNNLETPIPLLFVEDKGYIIDFTHSFKWTIEDNIVSVEGDFFVYFPHHESPCNQYFTFKYHESNFHKASAVAGTPISEIPISDTLLHTAGGKEYTYYLIRQYNKGGGK